MLLTAGGGGLPHVSVALDETAVRGLLEQTRQPVPYFPDEVCGRASRSRRGALWVSLPSSAASASPSRFPPSHPDRLPCRRVGAARQCSQRPATAASRSRRRAEPRHRRSTDRSARAHVLSTRRRRLFVPILVRPSGAAEPASLSVSGSTRSSDGKLSSADLLMTIS